MKHAFAITMTALLAFVAGAASGLWLDDVRGRLSMRAQPGRAPDIREPKNTGAQDRGQAASIASPSPAEPPALPRPLPPTPTPEPVEDPADQRRTELEARMREHEDRLASLSAQIQERERMASQQRLNQELRARQETTLLEARLARLQQQIANQDQLVRSKQAQLDSYVGPDDTDLLANLRSSFEEEQRRLQELRNEYSALLANQQAAIDQNYADQSQQLQDNTQALMQLRTEYDQTRSELERLQEQYDRTSGA